ncbi:MAG: metallophosphoesterase [Nanoarchaeota archaeon]
MKEKVHELLEKGLLLSPDSVSSFDASQIATHVSDDMLVVNDDVIALTQDHRLTDWRAFESALFEEETLKNGAYASFLEEARKEQKDKGRVKVIWSEDEKPKKITVDDFVAYFNKRFELIGGLLKGREELSGARAIARVVSKTARETVTIIGCVIDKAETKNKNFILTVEDQSGKMNVLVTPQKSEAYALAKDIVLDDILGIIGMSGNRIIFADSIVLPNIPHGREMKKAPDDAYAVFTGDIHIGSTAFLEEDFQRFISWIRGTSGTAKQREIAKKTKYLFLVGDLVDGIGVYPGQEEELTIFEIKKQYEKLAEHLRKIPSHIQIIICPGNHDAGRISEPQLPLYTDFASDLWAFPNVCMVSNPSYVNIHASENFSGIDVLLYHGFSFPYYADNVPSIKNAGGIKRPDLIMRFLLQRRHLAPTHTSNMYIPFAHKDPLVISRIPDLFVSGHIHGIAVASYRGVTLINSSCWTKITEYQEKRGIRPQPGRVPVVNLQTREVKVLNFLKEGADGSVEADAGVL